MEQVLGYIIFGTGWPVLIVGSVWMWRHTAQFPAAERTFLNIALISFYVLGYVCTTFWVGLSWYVGVLPAFAVFLALFIIALREVHRSSGMGHGSAIGAH
jgi:hypothetical protein